jgi:hypothetical protein
MTSIAAPTPDDLGEPCGQQFPADVGDAYECEEGGAA